MTMLCSICKKEQAVIFINEPTEKDPKHVTGYCIKCAKENSIDPLKSVLGNNDIDLRNIAEQFESVFNNLSNNMELTDMDYDEISDNIVPVGAIIGNIFSNSAPNGQTGKEKEIS